MNLLEVVICIISASKNPSMFCSLIKIKTHKFLLTKFFFIHIAIT